MHETHQLTASKPLKQKQRSSNDFCLHICVPDHISIWEIEIGRQMANYKLLHTFLEKKIMQDHTPILKSSLKLNIY